MPEWFREYIRSLTGSQAEELDGWLGTYLAAADLHKALAETQKDWDRMQDPITQGTPFVRSL